MMSKLLKIWVTVGLSVSALGLVEKPKPPTVFVSTASSSVVFDWLAFPARVVPFRNATILADTDGVVKQVLSPLGRSVVKGTPILVIVNIDPVYQYSPLTQIAPLAGVVSSVDVSEGSRVTKGQKLATVTDPASVKILIEVAASDLPSVSRGMVGDLHLSSQEKSQEVRVVGVSPFVDPATGTASAELVLAKKGEAALLAPGIVGRVTFRAREHSGLQVPEDAIVYRGATPHIRVVEGGKARYQPVVLGPVRKGQVEIVKGIQEGTVFIERASAFVTDGEVVTIETSGGQKG